MKSKNDDFIRANLHKLTYEATGELRWADNFGQRARKGCLAGYVSSSNGYVIICISGQRIVAHRIVWHMFNDSNPPEIDHINRVRNDNRIENLRAANRMTNQFNASMRSDNTSGHVGVSLHTGGKWRSVITAYGVVIPLGRFDRFSDACDAYNLAKDKYHKFH